VSIKNYLDPSSAAWDGIKLEHIPLSPTPVGLQPTEYVRNAWSSRPYGQVSELQVRSAHDGETWAISLVWRAGRDPVGEFQDSVAVAFPVRGQPLLATMGAADAPIHILRWIDGAAEVRSVTATGIGTSQSGPAIKSSARAVRTGETLQVVITRALGTGNDVAALAPGKKARVGFAVWRGANHERGGIKAFSIDWAALVLDA
jgi:DMSO reductase family type II enzyme heme b subunit